MKGFERMPDFAGFQVWRSKAPTDKVEVHFIAGIDPYDKGQFPVSVATTIARETDFETAQQMSKYFAEVKLTKEKDETESKRIKSTDRWNCPVD